MANVKIIDLPTGSPESDSFLEATQVNEQAASGRSSAKIAFNALANWVAGQGTEPVEYGDLNTEDETLIGGINELHNTIGADAYDDTATYNTGDYCIHNGELYKCNEENVTGAWNAAKWDATILVDELGGGGGSSTLAGLSDVDLTSPIGGQALVYDDVNDEWVNGDVSQVIANPIPVTSQMVIASSYVDGNFTGAKAFDGQSCNLSTLQGGWLANASDDAPYLRVDFGEAQKVGRVFIETANNNSPDTTREVYIEGSDNGNTWNNLLASGNTVSLTFVVGAYTQYSIELNESSYRYFRIRGTEKFFGGSFQYACCFSEVIIYDKASGIPAIADLTDVDLTSPTDGQLLRYNGTSGKWENAGIDSILTMGSEVTVSNSNPFITYRIYGKMLFLYVNMQNKTVTTDETLANLPAECTPLMGTRVYRGNGLLSYDSENNNRLWARSLDSWTTVTMVLPLA